MAYIRTTVSELMNWLDKQGNKVISCTTDGILTDHESLSTFTDITYKSLDLPFLCQYSKHRGFLGFANKALEEKYRDNKGIISITTRGQLGLSSKISALTSFSAKGDYSPYALRELLIQKTSSNDKNIRYPKNRLLGGSDIARKGGHVTTVPQEKTFRVCFDNRREVVPDPIKTIYGQYFNTIPHPSVAEIIFVRGLVKLPGKKYTVVHP